MLRPRPIEPDATASIPTANGGWRRTALAAAIVLIGLGVPATAAGGGDRKRAAAVARYAFTKRQLGAYGICELQTLESVLRQDGRAGTAMRDAVRARIQKKVDWKRTVIETDDARPFLEAFHAAFGSHLEAWMLFGVCREDKHDRR
jgi:hypothetical protein